jgi:hypothetical protein
VARRPPLRVLVAVGLVAGSSVALQVLLTRIFAAALFYHFSFLAISLALVGVGGGAIVIYVRPQWFDRVPLERALARWSIAYALLLLAVPAAIVRLDYLYTGFSLRFTLNLTAACVLAALPFLAAGVVVALAVRGYARSIGRLYAFDLAGAGLGAAAVVPLLWVIAAPTLVVALSLCAALAAALLAGYAAPERRAAYAALGLGAALVAVAGASHLYYLRPAGPTPDADRWTPLSRVLGFVPKDRRRHGLVIYDRVVGEIVPYHGGPYPGWRELQEGPQSIGFELTGPGRSLIIGGGGGRDILDALSERQRVDVIELNRGIRKVVDEDLRSFSGAPYSLPGVHTTIGDGRSTLAHRHQRYDQIQIGFTDTFSANSAQAFALTESNLYTVEAFREYLDHLRPNGILNLSRPVRHSGDEALRITLLALEALRQEGVRDPSRNVAVVLGHYSLPLKQLDYATVLVRRRPFGRVELARVRALAGRRGLGVAFAPGGPYRGDWRRLAADPDPERFCRDFPVDVCPPTDDKPFFFFAKRLSDLFGANTVRTIGVPDPLLILALALGILLAMCAAAFALPLALVQRQGRPKLGELSFFLAIGVGFLLLEVVLIQRFVLFLGFPTYALSVVLFALLAFTGVGSLLSTRAERAPRQWLVAALAVACALIAASAYALQPLLRSLIELPFAIRMAITVALLAPVGITLGTAMPIGLRRLVGLHPQGVPWAWGINGVASVLGSVLGVMIAINYGFAVTTLVALGCYLSALAHAALGRWPPFEAAGVAPAIAEAKRPELAGARQA